MKSSPFIATVLTVMVLPVAVQAADAKAGASVFKKCSACHTVTEPMNRVGPSLMGVVGRPVASAPNYTYSPAMKTFGEGGKVWSEAQLKEYLRDPRFVVSGTRMSFAGLKNDTDIDNVIEYLKNPAAAQ